MKNLLPIPAALLAVLVWWLAFCISGCAAPSAATQAAEAERVAASTHLEQLAADDAATAADLEAALERLTKAEASLAKERARDVSEDIDAWTSPGALREVLIASGASALVWVLRNRTRKRDLVAVEAQTRIDAQRQVGGTA